MNLTEWYETGDRFTWRGQEVFYQEAGEGEVLFMLHGFMSPSWIYKDIWEPLSQQYRVIAPDYVGFGYSSKPKDYDYSFDERAELVYAIAELIGVKKIHILASSFSTSVAQELMLRCSQGKSPIVIQSIAMLNGAIFHNKTVDPFRQKLMLHPLFNWISWFYGRGTFKSLMNGLIGRFSHFPDQFIHELFEMNRYNKGMKRLIQLNKYIYQRKERSKIWKQALIHTKIPVQLIWGIGSEEKISGLSMAHEYRDLKGDQYVVMIKDIGHFPHVECPEVVVDYYLNFLEGLKEKPFTGCKVVEATSS